MTVLLELVVRWRLVKCSTAKLYGRKQVGALRTRDTRVELATLACQPPAV